MIKKLLAALLAALTVCSFAACKKGGESVKIPASQTGSEDFQKNMHQSSTSELKTVCETENGFYFELDGAYIYYMEKETKKVTPLCAKPECEHNDESCNARIHATVLWFADNRLCYSNSDYIIENGTPVNYGERLYSVDPDGTNKQVVQLLDFAPGGDTSQWTSYPILHRGMVYFPYSGVLYELPLGGDIKDAKKIWGTEIEGEKGSIQIGDPNALGYSLWADGDEVYFMVNLKQENGTYKDTLFAYDTTGQTVRQVWQTPDADEVGEWESTGVSVSQWYVKDGYIYFYLSGGDFWRSSLESGGHEKLADTHEKTQYGSAAFSDEYLCLLNDAPKEDEFGGTVIAIIGSPEYTGGDTIFVYDLDGKFVKELSLKSLYDKIDNLEHCEIAFCSGSDIYFVADASTWSDRVNGVSHIIRNHYIYCVNIESGEITEIYHWE